jgi:hypothetical protein
MTMEQHEFLKRRTSPVVDRPAAGGRDVTHLWAYIEWLERCAWSAYTQLDEAHKDHASDRRSRDRSYARWIATYNRHKALRAAMLALIAADEKEWTEDMTDAAQA